MLNPPIYALLPSRAVIALAGSEWRSFLQGLITQDVETLGPGEARFGALLTPQGRLLYDLFVVGRDDGAWLDVAAEHRETIIGRLSMYRLRAKVEITASDLSVSARFPALPGEGRDPGPATEWVVDPRLPELGWRGYGASAPEGAQLADEAAYEAHRLALGVPGPADWGADKTYPIEANFDLLDGIDFKKGCFVGQETTSRMKRRGQVKTRMLPIVFDGPPPAPGAEVLAGELRAGEVLSGGDGRAMAALRLDRIAGGSLTVDGRPVGVERPAWFAAALGEEVA
ncbi:MAG: aminomethyltransferase [Phenylobacterium sp.]|nr:aminomethyltransferase [Phenylobacterium sp.]